MIDKACASTKWTSICTMLCAGSIVCTASKFILGAAVLIAAAAVCFTIGTYHFIRMLKK